MFTPHDVTQEVELHGQTQEVADEGNADRRHAVGPLPLKPVPAPSGGQLHHAWNPTQQHHQVEVLYQYCGLILWYYISTVVLCVYCGIVL